MSLIEKLRAFFECGHGDVVPKTVTVHKGDSLWAIAEHVTGDGNRWKELAEANPGKFDDSAYVIQPGEELTLPDSWCQ
jgi:nucleoid-associated protein YgaU